MVAAGEAGEAATDVDSRLAPGSDKTWLIFRGQPQEISITTPSTCMVTT
jgi:hypothetical protein